MFLLSSHLRSSEIKHLFLPLQDEVWRNMANRLHKLFGYKLHEMPGDKKGFIVTNTIEEDPNPEMHHLFFNESEKAHHGLYSSHFKALSLQGALASRRSRFKALSLQGALASRRSLFKALSLQGALASRRSRTP
jgi:hypothetical protein